VINFHSVAMVINNNEVIITACKPYSNSNAAIKEREGERETEKKNNERTVSDPHPGQISTHMAFNEKK